MNVGSYLAPPATATDQAKRDRYARLDHRAALRFSGPPSRPAAGAGENPAFSANSLRNKFFLLQVGIYC